MLTFAESQLYLHQKSHTESAQILLLSYGDHKELEERGHPESIFMLNLYVNTDSQRIRGGVSIFCLATVRSLAWIWIWQRSCFQLSHTKEQNNLN